MYNTNRNIRFKTTILKSSLRDYSDAYLLANGTITVTGAGAYATAKPADKKDKGVIFKNCAPLINCRTEINNTEIDNTKDIDIVMRMYKLKYQIDQINYSDDYSKTSESL